MESLERDGGAVKISIYIEQGVTQIVLTPESEWEKSVIRSVEENQTNLTIRRGQFYHCQGGWDRLGSGDDSLIIRTELRSKDERGLSTLP